METDVHTDKHSSRVRILRIFENRWKIHKFFLEF